MSVDGVLNRKLSRKMKKLAKQVVSTRLSDAVRDGDLERAKELIYSYGLSYSKEWSDGYVLLCEALINKHIAIAKLLLHHDCKVNFENGMPSTIYTSPLHLAIQMGDIEVVKMVLDKGARIDAKDIDGETPLYAAVRNDDFKITELLCKHGADVCLRNRNGISVIHIAASYGCPRIIDYLLKNGADVNVRTDEDDTPLHKAAT
jgi:ankyrin repeat protein